MEQPKRRWRIKDNRRTHVILFVITFITTTMAGSEWMFGRSFLYGSWRMGWPEFIAGLEYSIPFLAILTCHEFGHYFMAQYHKVKVTLPFYLPFWFGFLLMPSIGTFGAFIRIKERISDKVKNFDIGVAGPIAGFVIALLVLWYGFTNLPEKDHIYSIHPDYQVFEGNYADYVYTADTFILKSDVVEIDPIRGALLPDTLRYSPEYPSFAVGSTLLFDFFPNTGSTGKA